MENFYIRPDSVNVSSEINLQDEKLMHNHRFVLFDRPKPPKDVEIINYDMKNGSAILLFLPYFLLWQLIRNNFLAE